MAADSKQLEFDDMVLDTIKVRLREYRVEENSQIYFPPPTEVKWEELQVTEAQPLPPRSFPDDPLAPSQSPATPRESPDIPGVLETPQRPLDTPQGVAADSPDSEPLRGVEPAPDTVSGAPEGVGTAGQAGESVPPAPTSPLTDFADASIRHPPLEADIPTFPSHAQGTVEPPAAMSHRESRVEPPHVLRHPLGSVETPTGIPSEPLSVSAPQVQSFGPLPDVGPRSSVGELPPTPGDPTQMTDDGGWIKPEEELRREIVGRLVSDASPLVVEAAMRKIDELEDMFDERIHELDQRFLV